MNVDRALVFKSIDAKKQNPQNRPGKFTVKFFPELFLENNKQHFLALDHLSMTASWHNIRPEYDNNKLVISKDGGETWETITFPAGIFDYGDINELIHKRIGKTGISVLFDLSTYKVFIQLANGFQIDFTKSGNFNVLLGFEKKLVSSSEYGANFPNITNSVDNLYLRCNLLSDSIISGKRSNVLYTFSTSTKTRSMPFEIQPYNYLWSKINTKTITEVTFWFTDDEDREVNLNDIDISLTVVIKTKNGEKFSTKRPADGPGPSEPMRAEFPSEAPQTKGKEIGKMLAAKPLPSVAAASKPTPPDKNKFLKINNVYADLL